MILLSASSEIDYLFEEDSSLLRYPTQFLQGVVPINGHSHNEYSAVCWLTQNFPANRSFFTAIGEMFPC